MGTRASDVISIADLGVAADRRADVSVDLVVRQETFDLASGRSVDGYTVNGQSPGPTIEATEGDLVEVRLSNESVPGGVTLHWHGIDVPNPMDGVAGVTQDAVMEGESFTYRFVADQVGTYWYHSHQLSHEQVQGGLLGGSRHRTVWRWRGVRSRRRRDRAGPHLRRGANGERLGR